MKTLRIILGDQLNSQHTWFQEPRTDVVYAMMEVRQETDYVQHHIQKVIGFFAAMRVFARGLEEQGHIVHYLRFDDAENAHSFRENLHTICKREAITRFEYQEPDEYRLDQDLKRCAEYLHAELEISSSVCNTEHFITSRTDLAALFQGRKTYLLETFYRAMRRKHSILMDGTEPHTGQWNYDADNRKKLPRGQRVPAPLLFQHDVSEIAEMLQECGVQTIGRVDAKKFEWCISREEALHLLEYFASECLSHFGTYQDAMTLSSWAVFHARLSFAMNVKMLHPLEVVRRCVEEWQARPEEISYAQIEGFVRQIIGWREYMRGVYWAKMPDYAHLNALQHTAPLPEWYWTGETKMQCLRYAITQSLDHAYAHHIQRLMLTGNFALLLGVHPDAVDAWYLGIYIDAIEWVEITNTRGMSQFADGGIVGTKPYISSANYIDKMSDYCGTCAYDKSLRHGMSAEGKKACPFNSLYWDFYHRHEERFAKNPRVAVMYKTLNNMDEHERKRVLEQAAAYKREVESL
ncbi:MAG: cryptochrome/photolyase family protein [Candidatus Kapaibacterium sp.]|nr:MAG: cryptochrome/photolyase family protein [Candidatus Kapabacteria bacterium]